MCSVSPEPETPNPSDWVALLRGINVGRAKRIGMAELRAVFSDLGYSDVATVLTSGNVVFSCPASRDSPATRGRLEFEEAVAEATGVRSEIALLPAATLCELAAGNPLRRDDRDPRRLAVGFAVDTLDPAVAESVDSDALLPEELVVTPGAVYQWLPNGVLASTLPPSFWRSLGRVTARNDATVRRIVALLESRRR